MKGKCVFAVILVLTLLVALTGGISSPSIATASEQDRSLADSTKGQASNLGVVNVAAGDRCGEEGPAIYITCDSGTDISDDIQAAVNTLRDSGGVIYLPAGDFQFNTTVGSTYSQRFPGGISIIGQGVGQTILRSDGSAFFDINHWGQFTDSVRISGISFYGAPEESGTYTNQGIRINQYRRFSHRSLLL